MGNLMLAHALAHKYCRLAASTDWYTVSSPSRGSAAVRPARTSAVARMAAQPNRSVTAARAALLQATLEVNACEGKNGLGMVANAYGPPRHPAPTSE